MNKPEILQVGAYPEWDEKPLNELFTVHRYFEEEDKKAFLEKNAANIVGIATRGELGADKALIESLPSLEIISVYGVGYDAVDLDAAREKNIRVTNTPDVLTNDVADFAVAMMLSLSRQVIQGSEWVRSGNWSSTGNLPLNSRVHGKRVGILGLGRIGCEVAKRLVGFGMDVSYSANSAKEYASNWNFVADAVELAKSSDFLFVTLAASAETRHIVSKEVIEAVGSEGMIINVSRAANIDEEALLDALESGSLGFAALDVFEGEPALNPRFLALDNVILQPHQASGTYETRKAMGDLVRENLVAHFDGKELITAVL